MKIIIKRRPHNTAILISFDTEPEKFDSVSERNKFFTELHGRRQTITKESGKYVYLREGLLDGIPHIKVENSVFIIAMEHMRRMMEFFDEWDDKVSVKTFPVILKKKELQQLQEREIEIE